MFKKANRFAKGSGVYLCRCCNRMTRDTGGDGSSVQLCDICYDLAGYDNMVMDGETLTIQDKLQILDLVISIAKKHGDLDRWEDLISKAK